MEFTRRTGSAISARRVLSSLTSTKAQVAFTEPFERCAVRTSHVGVQRLSGRHEPRVILAHAPRGPTLHERTPLGLREVYALNDEALQRRESRGLVGRTLEDLFDADNGDDDSTPAQPVQQPPRRAFFASGGFAIESDQEGAIQQYRPAHRFL